jgi:hypothetical protein
MSEVAVETRKTSALSVLLLGGITVGTLDMLFAIIYWNSKGLTFARVFRGIAGGLLGDAADAGGTGIVWLGAGLHYFIATCMVVAYYLVSKRVPALTRRPIALGLAYGVFLYFFMNLIVLPLSAAGMPTFANHAWVGTSIVMHAIFGVICAMTARIALR